MKYYHIIFTASKKSVTGDPGFGVRTYTQGMPEEYLKAIEDQSLFTYESGEAQLPNPKLLLDNGELVNNMPITYVYSKVPVPALSKEIYVVQRVVSVGFEYTYYSTHSLARTGNYFVDAYVFEEYPGEEQMEILYEDPAPGANHFLPESPVPSPENKEMERWAIGEVGLLPVEDKPFRAATLPALHDEAYEILFAYIEATRLGKPLMIKCDTKIAPALMSDLLRLLPNKLESQSTFFINYQMPGAPKDYKVVFVNEHYSYEIRQLTQCYVLDLTEGERVDTIESRAYMDKVKQYNTGDKELDDMLEWMLHPAYAQVRECEQDVKDNLYGYVIQPDQFKISDILSLSSDKRSRHWNEFKTLFAKDAQYQSLFDELLLAKINDCPGDGEELPGFRISIFVELLKQLNDLTAAGFNLGKIIDQGKKALTKRMLQGNELADILKELGGIKNIDVYVDKSQFEAAGGMLDEDYLKAYWLDLYPYFCRPEEVQDKVSLSARAIKDQLSIETLNKLFKQLGIEESSLLSHFVNLGKKNADAATLWTLTSQLLDKLYGNDVHALAESVSAEVAEQVQLHLIAPLKDEKKTQNWNDRMDYIRQQFNEANADRLYKLIKGNPTDKDLLLIKEKALRWLSASNMEDFFMSTFSQLKKEKYVSFIPKIESREDFRTVLKSLIRAYGVKRADFIKHTSHEIKETKTRESNFDNLKGTAYDGFISECFGEEKVNPIKKFFQNIGAMIVEKLKASKRAKENAPVKEETPAPTKED